MYKVVKRRKFSNISDLRLKIAGGGEFYIWDQDLGGINIATVRFVVTKDTRKRLLTVYMVLKSLKIRPQDMFCLIISQPDRLSKIWM